MHRLMLKNVGPIISCDLPIDDFTVLTGPQASGKSTIAKSIFFFRTIKDDIADSMVKIATGIDSKSIYKIVQKQIRNKFLQIFGSSRAMEENMEMMYYYGQDTYISIRLELKLGVDFISPNYVIIDFSPNIAEFLNQKTIFGSKEDIRDSLNTLFCDEYETIFIPAGRSLITLLTTQLNYVYASMDEEQKRSIDYCTQKYIERILKIRPFFSDGIENYIGSKNAINTQLRQEIKLSRDVIKGEYKYTNGEERLYLRNKHYVKINYTSSGQQEAIWLINILMYQLTNNTKTFVIIEEPEAHLYPNSQKILSDIISVFISKNNTALITTHSPYILGEFNNLIYAAQISKESQNKHAEINKVVNNLLWISRCNAYFTDKGVVKECIEKDGYLIKNEVIDGASKEINKCYDALFEIDEVQR